MFTFVYSIEKKKMECMGGTMKFKRIHLIVMDSVGVGALPDAKDYGDENSNTLGNISKETKGIKLPILEKLGIGNLTNIVGVKKNENPLGYCTKLKEMSVGKDTMTGHWEMVGLKIIKPFKTFTETGFPEELLEQLKKETGRNILGNIASSGTEILDKLGEKHMATGDLIVYTSADSVLQIAAHEEIIPPEELWKICKIARKITMEEKWKVGRIIARPFLGKAKGEFVRTTNRHDYAVKPFSRTTLDELKDSGLEVVSIGKINDIFDTEGITRAISSKSNAEGMEKATNLLSEDFKGLVFLNLVDFDALYGHRRNIQGYKSELEAFDNKLGKFIRQMKESDLLIITADHGTDPTEPGSDHTREYVPLLMYSKSFKNGKILEDGDTFANIGSTIAENFNVKKPKIGTSYLDLLK